MAVAKKEKKEPSCPLWLATYGDMVTNMLVFFVLLLSMSEIKKDDRFIEFMQAIRDAFGYVGGIQHLPVDQELDVKNVDLTQMLIIPIQPHELSPSPDPGVRGKQPQVTDIRPTDHYRDGAPFYFDELSAEFTPDHERLLAEYVAKLQGHRTQIEVRGHCSRVPVADTPFRDHYDLALARARIIADQLVDNGIAQERIVLVSVGVNEPVVTGAYTPAQRRENDRVEVFQIARRVSEFRE